MRSLQNIGQRAVLAVQTRDHHANLLRELPPITCHIPNRLLTTSDCLAIFGLISALCTVTMSPNPSEKHSLQVTPCIWHVGHAISAISATAADRSTSMTL